MEVHFTAADEAKLRTFAQNNGCKAEELVTELVRRFLAHDEQEIRELGAAIDEADGDIDAGHYTDYNENTLSELFRDVRTPGSEQLRREKLLERLALEP
jgi:UDP-N-acetylmuramyl tripeptide synthase